MKVYETLIFNINLIYLIYELWLVDIKNELPSYIFILVLALIGMNATENMGFFTKVGNSKLNLLKYTRNEKEMGISCGVNTIMSVVLSLVITKMKIEEETPYMTYLLYCFHLTILFSICYWVLMIYLRLNSNTIKIAFINISAIITFFIITKFSLYFGISVMYFIVPIFIFCMAYAFLIFLVSRSFTLSEASIVAQGFTIIFNESLIFFSYNINLVQHPSLFIFKRTKIFSMLKSLINGAVVSTMILYPFLKKTIYYYQNYQNHNNRSSDREIFRKKYKKNSMRLWVGFVSLILFMLTPYSTSVINENPFIWVIKYISRKRRIALILWWLCVLGNILIATKWLLGKTLSLSDLNKKRKFYHMLSVIMFFPGYLLDKDFMYLSFAVAFCAMLLIEIIRYFRIYPLGSIVHKFMVSFVDQKDHGKAILSHIYLLIGCGLPVWLNSLSNNNVLSGIAGILALGIGDTMASLVGYKYGKIRWPNSKKTVEGTVAFIFSILIFVFFTNIVIYSYQYDLVQWIKFILITILTGLLEASSNENDNLILPLFMFSLTVIIK